MTAAGLALGTVQWGLRYGVANKTGRPTVEAIREILAAAATDGVDTLDTARAYGDSEAVLGEVVGAETRWRVFTKLAPLADTPAAATHSLAESRAALRRERLDAVLLHRWNNRGGVWDVLRQERDAGRVGVIGGSAADPNEAWEMLADPDVTVIQVATSLFDQRLSRAGFFDRAQVAGKSVFVRSVFLQGAAHLPYDRLPQHLAPLADTLYSVRQWAGDLPTAVPFLAFAAGLSGVRVLVGCESLAQMRDNLSAWQLATMVDVRGLAASVPDLPWAILDPAHWPST